MSKKKKNREYNILFEQDLKVIIEDVAVTEEYFIKGDWRKYFYDLDSIEDLVRDLAANFLRARLEWGQFTAENEKRGDSGTSRTRNYKFIEGYGIFLKDTEDKNLWVNTDPRTGGLSVRIASDLEITHVAEVIKAERKIIKSHT